MYKLKGDERIAKEVLGRVTRRASEALWFVGPKIPIVVVLGVVLRACSSAHESIAE